MNLMENNLIKLDINSILERMSGGKGKKGKKGKKDKN